MVGITLLSYFFFLYHALVGVLQQLSGNSIAMNQSKDLTLNTTPSRLKHCKDLGHCWETPNYGTNAKNIVNKS